MKNQLAHIVSVAHLEQTANNPYHMCLAHLVLSNPTYAAFYRRMSDEGKFVIMDNGAAEHSQIPVKQLLEAYYIVRPTEMVLLDTLSDGDSTYERTKQSLAFFINNGVTCRFMAVPQGHSLADWTRSALQLIQLDDVDTIGVSKFLTITSGSRYVRYHAVRKLEELMKRTAMAKDVHLLGCDAGPSEVKQVFDSFDFVRGCDTALAYIHAVTNTPMVISSERPHGEIDFVNGQVDRGLLQETMNTFDKLCNVKKGE